MNLSRDSYSGAIINQDVDEYNQARIRKKNQKRRIKLEQYNQSFRHRIDELEQRLTKIEEMLYK